MYRGLLRSVWIVFMAGIMLGITSPLPARADTLVVDPRAEYIFGSYITFRAQLKSDIPISEARFFFRRPEDVNANVIPAVLDTQGTLSVDYDNMRFPLRAFSRVNFWFEVTAEGGAIIQSSPEIFYYEDNRFAWQILQSGPFHVHWYEGDTTFGQELLDVAQKGLQQAYHWLPFGTLKEMNIYVYASAQEMRSTLMLAGTNWVAGHADPDLNLIVVTLPPGPEQKMEMERQIPHELMHNLLYLTIGPDYYKLPTWLNEGLASVNEIYPNPYYHNILSQAAKNGILLTFNDICQNFPADASGTYLAYAQAASFTRFLFEQYGSEGMETLVVTYTQSDERDCQDGTANALGTTLTQLEQNWRQTILGEEPIQSDGSSPWPWVMVLGVVLIVPFFVIAASAISRTRHSQTIASSRKVM